MQRLLHSGLVRSEILFFLDMHDIFSLARVSRDFYLNCTANNLALRGRKRALIVPHITINAKKVEDWNVAWELVTSAQAVGDVHHVTPVLQAGNVEKLDVSLENSGDSDIFTSTSLPGLIRLVQAVATLSENTHNMQKIKFLSFDFGEASEDVKVAPLISHLLSVFARLPQISELSIAHIPAFASLALKLPAKISRLSLRHWYSPSLEGAALRRLSSLTLGACCIQTAVTEKLFRHNLLPLLEELNLADNIMTTLRGNLLDCEFSDCLRYVDLSRNRLVEDVSSVVEFIKKNEMRKMDISSNMLGDWGFSELLAAWKRLQVSSRVSLVLEHNGITICARMTACQDELPTRMMFE